MYNIKITSALQIIGTLEEPDIYWLRAIQKIYSISDSEMGYIVSIII